MRCHALRNWRRRGRMGSYKADESSGMVLLAGNSHPELARLVSDRLNVKLGDAIVYNKTNRETTVDIKQSVRGKHVFIIQSGHRCKKTFKIGKLRNHILGVHLALHSSCRK
ncbi:unnamed protein product [Toxocara canis]|uniref:Pribosyltran_N domain-containing protein n=1 Tax=Toxocara canis TaxID=6265 RepID=A0A183UBM7_TOXCA|nr:unnamed protein product [Toxocara canis]